MSRQAMVFFALLMGAAMCTAVQAFEWAGYAVFAVGLAAGLGLSFYAMIKYNKGIFLE